MLDWRWRPNKHAPLWASWVHAAAFVSPRVCSAGASQAPASCVAAPYTPPCDLRERNMCCTWWNHPTGAACAACVPVARAGEQGETCVLGVLATRGDVGTWQHELCYRVCGLVCVDSCVWTRPGPVLCTCTVLRGVRAGLRGVTPGHMEALINLILRIVGSVLHSCAT